MPIGIIALLHIPQSLIAATPFLAEMLVWIAPVQPRGAQIAEVASTIETRDVIATSTFLDRETAGRTWTRILEEIGSRSKLILRKLVCGARPAAKNIIAMPGSETDTTEGEIAVFTNAQAVFVIFQVLGFGVPFGADGFWFEVGGCRRFHCFLGITSGARYALAPLTWAVDGLRE